MEWINALYRLPEFDEHVIVSTQAGVTTGRLIKLDRSGQHWEFNERNDMYWSGKKVVYWMPLPQPPKN